MVALGHGSSSTVVVFLKKGRGRKPCTGPRTTAVETARKGKKRKKPPPVLPRFSRPAAFFSSLGKVLHPPLPRSPIGHRRLAGGPPSLPPFPLLVKLVRCADAAIRTLCRLLQWLLLFGSPSNTPPLSSQ